MGKFCSNCGKEDTGNSNFCQFCGNQLVEETVATQDAPVAERNGMATAGFVLSFFVSVLGLIFSIIGLVRSRRMNGNGRGLAIAGIIISAIHLGLSLLVYFGYFVDLINTVSYY